MLFIDAALVLIGNSPMGANIPPSSETIVKGCTLTESEAEYVCKVICQGAVLTVVSKTCIGEINEWRKKPVVNLVQLQNVEGLLKSGLTEITSPEDFLITPATTEDYVKWVHSFIKPPPKETT
jgi:TRAP-type C4-dicarboxylate transport system permease large subunit